MPHLQKMLGVFSEFRRIAAHTHLRRCLAGSSSRDVCPQATPVDNLDDACLAATLQPAHALTTLVLSPK